MTTTRLRLGAMLSGCALLAACAAQDGPHADFLARVEWPKSSNRYGGFSGIEVSPDGTGFVAITDRGDIVHGALSRENGRLTGIQPDPAERIPGPHGAPLQAEFSDAEGLALSPEGRLFVSVERVHRVLAVEMPDESALLPASPGFDALSGNSGLEALAIDAQGRLYTLPERSGQLTRAFPVWRYDGDWTQVFAISRSGGFLPVGADFGPDGRFYLLERAFSGIAFRSRIRRFTLEGDIVVSEETLLQTAAHQFGNLEGLSAWRDATGAIRLTLITDDNLRSFQRNEIVEFRVTE